MNSTPHEPPSRPSASRLPALERWPFLGGSLLLHLAVPLGLMLLVNRDPAPAPASPHGALRERWLDVEMGNAAVPSPEAVPSPASPEEVPQPSKITKPAPAAKPETATSEVPARPEAAARPRPAAQAKRPGPRPSDPERDWMSLDDQLDEPGDGSAEKPTPSAPAVDPLLERLLAAEARKAREHAPPADPSPRPAAPALAAPARPSAGVETAAAARGNTNLPVALARGLSEQIPVDSRWERAPLGRASAELVVQLHGGRIVEHRIGSTSSPELERSLSSALFVLERRRFDGGEIHPPDATLRLRVEISVRELSEGSAPGRPPFIQHRTGPSGEYLPRARIILPSLRQIEIEVLKRTS